LLRNVAQRFADAGFLGALRIGRKNNSFRNIESTHFQLATNPWSKRVGVLGGDAKNEFSQSPAHAFSSLSGAMR
jgi:hypothetical protein